MRPQITLCRGTLWEPRPVAQVFWATDCSASISVRMPTQSRRGVTADARNVVCNNGEGGVNLVGFGNTIQGNWIGVDAAGNAAGNRSRGIDIPGSNNLIGGSALVLATSLPTRSVAPAGVGVRVQATGSGTAPSARNSIFSNGSLRMILLPPAGVTPNDDQDFDFCGNLRRTIPS